jgi:hypothetical protein
MSNLIRLLLFSVFATSLFSESKTIPEHIQNYLSNYCLECHDAATEKADINLEFNEVNWSKASSQDLWQDILWVSEDELMPPAKKKNKPTLKERQAFVGWVKSNTLQYQMIGGTLPRRLNQTEYQNTIRNLFNQSSYSLPAGFPRDSVSHGFNNQGEGLKISPPLLQAYAMVASEMADELFPRQKEKPKSVLRQAKAEDMVISFAAASMRNSALRLASKSTDTMRGSTWLSRIEITDSGRYKIKVSASKFLPVTPEPMILEVRARDLNVSDRASVNVFRHLIDIPVHSGSPESTSFEADLYEGQTLLFRWKNAELDHQYNALAKLFEERFKNEKRFHAAWLDLMYDEKGRRKLNPSILRGENGYNKLKARLADENLDLTPAHPDSVQHKAFMKFAKTIQATTSIADTLAFDYFEHGPALELHEVSVEGPVFTVEGPKDKRRQKKRDFCFGQRHEKQSDLDYAKQAIAHFMTKAFRRPADENLVQAYHRQFEKNLHSGLSYDECFHLLIRNVLVSPRFLYRSLTPGKMDSYDLATRLAYFLTQSPPDERLFKLAQESKLNDDKVFLTEVIRLMPKKVNSRDLLKGRHHTFVENFVSQWLHLTQLKEIMPAPEFNFTEKRMQWAKDETQHFFTTMLAENRPIEDFIDPDFTFTTRYFLKHNYKTKLIGDKNKKDQDMQRFKLKRGSRHGGLLGQASVMIATANGVDTQPVVRGVWVMENILGQKVPPPPKNVPALTPDTQKATTPRELLVEHTKDAACMSCHERMDPLGIMLENFDPVGKWREMWPKINKKIDSKVELRDGTKIKDVVEFKNWLLKDIDLFSQCLSEKLMTYATGRTLNYREKHELEKIVAANRAKGNKFKDLFLALVNSEVFKTK